MQTTIKYRIISLLILATLHGVLYSQSNPTPVEGNYKIVLDKSMINPEIDIFRLKGFEVALIVSENFKNKFEKQNCIGVKFQKVT